MTSRLRVAVETPQHTGLASPLDYLSERPLAPGSLVRVPLGRRELTGIVWPGTPEESGGDELKAVISAFDALPPLNAAWCQLVEFAAGYYQRGVGELALSVLPPELHKLDDAQLANRIAKLHKKWALEAVAPASSLLPALSAEQAQAMERWQALSGEAPPATVLLHGTTGSGKTEIYLRAAQQALDAGRQALVLVPEINLTPQLEARFAERFAGRRIVSLHSALTPAQRLRHWLAA
ncbi:MAG TPA: DEAD/DEAH box helicase, partial [Albitalea sp.]|nr:DEAD/DEAH box helicase [Albitalea sp.]